MTMRYRLWDHDINRLFGTYDNEEDALALVRTLLSAYGEDYANDLSLGCERPDGTFTEPLTGAGLVARANEGVEERERSEGGGRVIASGRSGGSGYSAPMPMAAKGLYRFAVRTGHSISALAQRSRKVVRDK